jgi:hypothetical protein
MSTALRAPSAPVGLSQLAEEFRQLDQQRRRGRLSVADSARYHSLFARLSDALASGQRHRRADARQFLRVSFPMQIVLQRAHGPATAQCHDFGGGGCSISSDERLERDDDVWLDGAIVAGTRHELHGRAVVAWVRSPSLPSGPGYGLRFAIDQPRQRDEIDRLFYRVLDRFLRR